MEKKATEAQKYVWEGAIPLQIRLHESEVTTVPPPPPALVFPPSLEPLFISVIALYLFPMIVLFLSYAPSFIRSM